MITGGASGIGEATVRLFISHGAQVVIADVQDERARRLAEELGPSAAYFRTDVREERAIEAPSRWRSAAGAASTVSSTMPARAGSPGGVESISAEGFDATMALLVRAVLLGMKHAAPVMRRQRSGSIISTASVAGLRAAGAPTSTARPRPR